MSQEILDAVQSVKSELTNEVKTTATAVDGIKTEVKAVAEKTVSLSEALNAEIASLKETQETLEAKMNRPSLGGQDEAKAKQAEVQSNLKSWFAKGGNVAHGTEDNIKAYSTLTGAAGGDAVVDLLDTNLIRLLEDQVVMRRVCNVVRTSNPTYSRNVKIGADGAQWIAEGANVAESDTGTVQRVTFTSGKVASYPTVTNEALNDVAFNVDAEVLMEMAHDFAVAEDVAFMNGDGSGKPTGLLTATLATTGDETRAFGTFQKVQHSLSNVDGDTLIDAIIAADAELKAGYARVLMMNAKTRSEMAGIKDADGRYILENTAEDGFAGRIFGIPVVINSAMPDSADGNTPIILGDFKAAYTILDIAGSMNTLRDPYTKPGSVKFYADRRVGGGITDTQALKFIEVVV